MLPLAPTEDEALVTAEEAGVASAGDLAYVADWDVLDEDWGVFMAYRIVNTQLTKLVCTHGIDVVIVGDEAGVRISTGH